MKSTLSVFALSLTALTIAAPCHALDGLRAFRPDSLPEIVSQAGAKPLVVLIWSLDCHYCSTSLQALSQLKAARGIEVATVATDPFDDAETRHSIAQKLLAGGMTGPAWAFGPWPDARLRYAIDPKWRGELPRSYWYENGRLIASHSGAVTSEMAMKYFQK